MNLKNWLTLTIRIVDFSLVAKQPDLLSKLRKLTLSSHSGLNHELNRMLKDVQERPVNCKILLAQRFGNLLGWALLSKENTDFDFFGSNSGFRGEDGYLFQVFVDPKQRRRGIGSALYEKAQKLVKEEVLFVCPWDQTSVYFYCKYPQVKRKLI